MSAMLHQLTACIMVIPVVIRRDTAVIDLLWGNWVRSCYCLCCHERWHLIFPSTKHVNVFYFCFVFFNFTGQYKCGTWTSVTRCVKLLKSYCCLLFIYPVKLILYLCTNKCRYQLKLFLKMKVSLCVFQALLIRIFSSPSPRSCGQHNWGQGRACPPSSYTHQRRARPGVGPSEARARFSSSLGACWKRSDCRAAEESRATSGTKASFSQQGPQPPWRKV